MASIYAVSDRLGFVGAFDTLEDAMAAVEPYCGIPFVYGRWPRAREEKGDEDLVWALPYEANEVTACLSDDKKVVERAQAALLRLGLVPPDDVTYWEAVVGEIIPPAKKRLDEVLLGMRQGGGAPPGEEATNPEPPAADEVRRINLLDFVVPNAAAP